MLLILRELQRSFFYLLFTALLLKENVHNNIKLDSDGDDEWQNKTQKIESIEWNVMSYVIGHGMAAYILDW